MRRRHPRIASARLAKYRAGLEAGISPDLIEGWTKEVEAERLAAQRELDGTTETTPMTEDEVRALVSLVKAGLVGLSKASPAQKAAMYRTLGLKLTYHPESDTLDIEARPDAYTRGRVGGGVCRVGGPSRANPDWRLQPWDLGK